jgi:glycolate oxidase FAD binding subunit
MIGVQLALADGRLIKAGGNVVKNVAGYDLGKLVSGSFGSLAAIVTATFKLLPMPVAFHTLIATFQTWDAAARAAAAMNDSQLEPIASEIHAVHSRQDAPPYRLLVRFAGTRTAAASQSAQARTVIGSGELLEGDAEAAAWRRYVARSAGSADTIVRISWLPANLPQVLGLVEALGRTNRGVELIGRAAVGAGLVRIEGDIESQAAMVEQLRRSNLVAHATVRDAPLAVKQQVDAWGQLGASGTLASRVKRALDPAGILNAGRGPI